MDIQRILQNPELIKDLNSQDKTKLYMQLNNLKNDINNKLTEYKAKKDLLEKQKQEIQDELFKEANVTDNDSLVNYVSNLQKEFNMALENQVVELNDAMNKLNM